MRQITMARVWLVVILALSSVVTARADPSAAFVGRTVCARCHAGEAALWQGSHHDLAMQAANEHTVLGNFDNVSIGHFGITSTFFRKNGRFFLRTDGLDGKLRDYEI